jgi:hypothetical protein
MNLAALVKWTSCSGALFFLIASPAVAAPLAGNALAYNDGMTTWSGSTPFVQGTLQGDIEWAVFAPGDFNAAYPGAAYVAPGKLIYAYQVFVTGTAPLSQFSVSLQNPAGDIGSFEDAVAGITGADYSSAGLFSPGSADWDFQMPTIPQGSMSRGLVFSSDRVPMSYAGGVLDDGQIAAVIPLPSPDGFPIPEPSTVTMLGLAGFALLPLIRRRLNRDKC